MSERMKASLDAGPHFQLSKLVGNWEGKASVWFEPGVVADESPTSGTIRPLLDGKFVLHEYKGSMGGKPLQGMAIIGYHLDLQKFQVAWIDSFHNGTAIMFSQGAKGAEGMDVLGGYAYVTPEEEQHWGWRTEIDLISDNELVITSFNISPAGEEDKATETRYRRVEVSGN
jgi:hypothetical protein